jgi:hypothetical protein
LLLTVQAPNPHGQGSTCHIRIRVRKLQQNIGGGSAFGYVSNGGDPNSSILPKPERSESGIIRVQVE